MSHEDWDREELFTDPEEFVTFAQAYYATEFPNDGRRDCPPAEALREAARSSALPEGRLRSHLFSCSECFRSYRSTRMSQRAQAAPAASSQRPLVEALASIKLPWGLITTGACCLLFLSLITAALLRRSRIDSPVVTVNYAQQESPPAASPSGLDGGAVSDVPEPEQGRPRPERPSFKTSSRASRSAARNPLPRTTLRVVYVDLKEDDLLRGDDEGGTLRRIITLSPERQRLRLRMPRGSPAGRYTVRVVDPYGKSLLTVGARSGGRTLTVDLDLRGLTAKLYRLCLSRDGEAPDCYLLSIDVNTLAQ